MAVRRISAGGFELVSQTEVRVLDGLLRLDTANKRVSAMVDGVEIASLGAALLTNATTSRTLALSDAGAYIRTTSGSATTVTVPPDSDVAFASGTEVTVFQAGAGQVTFAAGSGVTINSASGNLKLTGQYSAASLKKVAVDTWDLIGDLGA